MEKIMLTCPFTGVEFEAMKDQLGNVFTRHAITGESIRLAYIPSTRMYSAPTEAFRHVKTITPSDAAELIGISKSRVSTLCQSGRLKSVTIGNSVFISEDSAIEYRDSERKAGRRW